jgi:hypothetical protein
LNCEHNDQRQRIIEKQLRNIRAVWRLAGALLTMGHRYGSGTSRWDYIHPYLPPEPVRQAYYSDLQSGAGHVLESTAWGWHSETAIHVLRMVLAGTLDRHPRGRNAAGDAGAH